MKIVFFGYSGVHTATIAAAVYLEKLSIREKTLRISEIPFFGSREIKYKLLFHGVDREGNQVYSIGTGNEMILVPKFVHSFLDIYHIPSSELIFINTLMPVGKITKIGEYLISIGICSLGNFFVQKGVIRDLPALANYIQRELKDSNRLTY